MKFTKIPRFLFKNSFWVATLGAFIFVLSGILKIPEAQRGLLVLGLITLVIFSTLAGAGLATDYRAGEALALIPSLEESENITILKIIPDMRDIDVTTLYLVVQKHDGQRCFYYAPDSVFEAQPYEGDIFTNRNGKMVRKKGMIAIEELEDGPIAQSKPALLARAFYVYITLHPSQVFQP